MVAIGTNSSGWALLSGGLLSAPKTKRKAAEAALGAQNNILAPLFGLPNPFPPAPVSTTPTPVPTTPNPFLPAVFTPVAGTPSPSPEPTPGGQYTVPEGANNALTDALDSVFGVGNWNPNAGEDNNGPKPIGSPGGGGGGGGSGGTGTPTPAQPSPNLRTGLFQGGTVASLYGKRRRAAPGVIGNIFTSMHGVAGQKSGAPRQAATFTPLRAR